jgi:hypothetical protein
VSDSGRVIALSHNHMQTHSVMESNIASNRITCDDRCGLDKHSLCVRAMYPLDFADHSRTNEHSKLVPVLGIIFASPEIYGCYACSQ